VIWGLGFFSGKARLLKAQGRDPNVGGRALFLISAISVAIAFMLFVADADIDHHQGFLYSFMFTHGASLAWILLIFWKERGQKSEPPGDQEALPVRKKAIYLIWVLLGAAILPIVIDLILISLCPTSPVISDSAPPHKTEQPCCK
jgi:hypothetical protein